MTIHRLAGAFLALMFGVTAGPALAAKPVKAPPASRVRRMRVHIRLAADGRAVTTTHAEIEATNDAAAMKLGQIALTYDASMSTLDITNAYTLKKDGTKIPVDVSAIYDQLAPVSGNVPMLTEYHRKTIVFPQFAAGDTAVYTAHYTAKKAMLPGQFWTGQMFPHTVAYDSVDETISVPDSLHLRVETHDVEFSRRHRHGRTIYHWHYSAPTPEAPEHVAIADLAGTPRFFVSTFKDYRALGAAYAAAAAPKAAVTPAIRALAAKLTRGIDTKRAQARALYDWVSTHIRYVAVELGRGSLIPHAAQAVLTKGYGDCKDHVTLLAALLKARGIGSEGVLINATNDYNLTDVPTFTGLDHIITYVPKFDLYLDSTAIVAPFGVLSFNEYGKPVVYAAQDDARRGTMPVLAPGQADLYTKTVSTLAKDGTLTGTTTTTGRGSYQLPLRFSGFAAQAEGPDVLGAKIMTQRGYGGDATGTLTAPPPTTPGDSYTVTGTFKSTAWKEQAAGTRQFVMPGGMRVADATGDGLMGRFGNTGLKADASEACYSGHMAEDLSLTAPDGMAFDHVPKDVHVTTSYLRFDAHWSLSGNTLSVHRDFTSRIDQPLCTPDIRKADKAALKQISDSYDVNLSLNAAGGAAGQHATTPEPAPSAMLQKAVAAAQVQNYGTAIRLLTQILDMPSLPMTTYLSARYDRAKAYELEGQFDKAIADLDDGLEKRPGDVPMLLLRGGVYCHVPDTRRALKDFDSVLKKEPTLKAAFAGRGSLLLQMGDYKDAVKDLSYVLYQSPDWTQMLFFRAVAYEKLGEHDKAVADIDHAAKAGDWRAKSDFEIVRAEEAPVAGADKNGASAHSSAPGMPSADFSGDASGLARPMPANDRAAGAYPPVARRLGDQGQATVKFTVLADGRVQNPTIVKSSGFADLDQAALHAVLHWRYHPATRDGKPIAIRDEAKMRWSLK